MKNSTLIVIFFILITGLMPFAGLKAQKASENLSLRISVHIFNNDEGSGNFHPDTLSHTAFLREIFTRINHRLLNLDTLKPPVSSAYIASTGLQLRIDSIFYHNDRHAWDCSAGIDSHYMRAVYVDQDTSLNYKQKHQTLHVFLGDNYSILGGHNSLLGDKRFIAMRGMFTEYKNRPYNDALRDCARGLLHELGHSLGLSHNFSGGAHGNQCDECEDNGCPQEGTSNNIMDYWPSFGYAISSCQLDIINQNISGIRGNISDVVCNDSCYTVPDSIYLISAGEEVTISDTVYMHGDLHISAGGRLIVSGFISFPQGSSLIVKDDGELILRGGTLGNLCGDLWEGVSFVIDDPASAGDGKMDFKSGVIENAYTAIKSDKPGLLSIESMVFRNNMVALDISGQGQLKAYNSTFETSRKLNHWEEGWMPEVFVRVTNGSHAKFDNCVFVNHEGHRKFDDIDSGIGIFLEDAGLSVQGCLFRNLFKGIFASSRNKHDSLSIYSSRFEMNHCGAHLDNFPQAHIFSSEFSLSRLNMMPTVGVFASNVSLFRLNGNSFISDYGGSKITGIYSLHTFPGTHIIENNAFENVGAGIISVSGNGVPEWPDILLECSEQDLLKKPLGSICYSNSFGGIEKELVFIDNQGAGLVRGTASAFEIYETELSRNFPAGGFLPFSEQARLMVINPNLRPSGDMSFFILYDESPEYPLIPGIDELSADIETTALSMELSQGRLFPEIHYPVSFSDMILIAGHLEKFPWLSGDPLFKDFLTGRMEVIPFWLWNRINLALSAAGSWKRDMKDLIISIAAWQWQSAIPYNSVPPEHDYSALKASKAQLDPLAGGKLLKLGTDWIAQPGLPVFDVVPNPANGIIGLRFNGAMQPDFYKDALTYRIIDYAGRMVEKGELSDIDSLLIDLGTSPAGSYLIEIWMGNEFLGIQKFIILPD